MRHIQTERLLLRAISAGDAEALYAIFGDPETNRYNPHGPHSSIEHARMALAGWTEEWKRHGFGRWSVACREEPGRIIGFGGLSYGDYGGQDRLNLGYRFAPSAWGKGLASEMARQALQCAFEALAAPAVFAKVRPANLPSIRVLLRSGFSHHGSLRDIPAAPASLVYISRAPAK
ncbi:GNAT family N-acetyltransferase [Chromobacterium piscinae]|uniref:GNAT family N-acetyltransferase n=1 Tax=Chromobacterium piscinae TaxID=686831 RepID=A0ABV0H4A9_9NEIS|nr:GNAT family N-acetyltransferase [Chromobacterium piscinae]MBX9298949.1 GNAT family N-acetyltransferase [Chromobacterium vaccinii]MBX9348212.1 GNAT family N-acetyltransferase [Chromobacterium vaccinii]MBX9358497.1 GNAT family N-acetyltransferase [Chromobacterium vaccinii]MCD4503329.1 GNAT family N-acetyltransferase [Chromobacterium piscinae]MCD5329109.1 GNAT family N-acetyltransferase [Chromobacterium piscinae]